LKEQILSVASLPQDDEIPAFAGMTLAPSIYGTRASGIFIEPSGCWYCSIIATQVLPIASPDPFNV